MHQRAEDPIETVIPLGEKLGLVSQQQQKMFKATESPIPAKFSFS